MLAKGLNRVLKQHSHIDDRRLHV